MGYHGRKAESALLVLYWGWMAVVDTALSRTICEMLLHQIMTRKNRKE